jgi:1-acyl-sn-glycerol-3-phosphate acyltransferase
MARVATFGSPRAQAWVGSRAGRVWGRLMCAILGVRRHVEGEPPRGCFVVAANHLSYLDIFVLSSLYPSTFVAKREISSWPLFGLIARGSGTLFVDRGRAKDVVRVGDEMTRMLRAGCPLTLFPEGKSSPGREVLPFMPSLLEPAARVGVPCYAVSLSYETPGSEDPPSITVCWYDSYDFVRHILRLMKIPRIVARVRFAPAPFESSDRKELARRLWDDVRASFVPVRQAAGG